MRFTTELNIYQINNSCNNFHFHISPLFFSNFPRQLWSGKGNA